MVGINNDHSNACLDSDDITFVIPFHGSGNTTLDIQQLMNLLGEDIDRSKIKDYADYENDSEIDTSKQIYRDVRKAIVSGEYWKDGQRVSVNTVLEEQKDADGNVVGHTTIRDILESNQYLKDLYRRFYLDATDEAGNLLGTVTKQNYQAEDLGDLYANADTEAFNKKYYLNNTNECYHNFLAGKGTTDKIFPYEYWNKSLTQSEAKANGDAFIAYCESLGLNPRFNGKAKGKYDAAADFTKNNNYWKLLIDRKMYDNRGNYRAQQKINLNGVVSSGESEGYNFADLNPAYATKVFGDEGTFANEVNPKTEQMIAREKSNAVMSKINDPTKIEAIATKSANDILRAREQTQSNRKEGERPAVHPFANDEDVWQALDAGDADTAAEMMTNDNGTKMVTDGQGNFSIAYSNISYIPQEELDHKQQQFDIIQATNPANDDIHTWIRSPQDIKTFLEAYEDDGHIRVGKGNVAPDFTGKDWNKAYDKKTVTVYSQHPIENGAWVTPSRMEAQSYAGDGEIYSKTVYIDSVAWVDSIQGMYADVPVHDADLGLNFKDKTGELLDRVFDGTKKYETRNYTDKQGNGRIPGAYLNKPMGIIQTGAGQAYNVGYWKLSDGELRDYLLIMLKSSVTTVQNSKHNRETGSGFTRSIGRRELNRCR